MASRLGVVWGFIAHYKYLVVTLLGILIVGFIDENSFMRRIQLELQISDLQSDIKKYNKLKTVAVKKYSKLGVESKAIDSKKSLAAAIGRSIHTKGLRSTRYFDKARDSVYGTDFQKVMNAALGFDVEIKITQIANEIKDGNNNTK